MQIQHWYIGIDVSKGYGDFLMLDENRSTIDKAYKLPDSPGGHEKLLKKIQILLDTSEDVRIQVGVESTGGYENHWCQLLRNYSDRLTVYRINPRAINAFSKGQMTRNGTDSISANLIANYMISHPQKLKDFQLQKVRHEDFFKGKKHLHFINLLIKQETQMRNAFEKVLFEYYPSFLALNKRKAPMYLLHLLSNHPDPKKILNLDESVLCEIPGVTKERLIQLRAARELQHIANQPDFDLIQVSAQQILHQNRLIALQKRQLATKYKNLSGVDLLVSIPGVGIDSAINLILEIGDIKRFESAKKLVAYFGMNPTMKQSGDGSTKARLDKGGSSSIRARLFMCIFSMISGKGIFKKRYQVLRANGRSYKDASCILMHKLLRIVFGILRSGQSYDGKIDEAYQKKTKEARKSQEKKKNNPAQRELQKLYNETFFEAPISSYQAKKLKKQTDVPIE